MTDAHFNPQSQPHPQFAAPDMENTTHSPKRRKIIGQCPTCHETFASRFELREHMADPQTHPPADESDAVSFGEMSDYDSLDDEYRPQKKQSAPADEPTLEDDGFEFTESNDQNGFEFFETDPGMFPQFNAEQGSVHTIDDENEQPSAEHKHFKQRKHTSSPRKQALGVLYCGTCDKYFGNEKVFKRHFMFGIKHGEEPRRMRDLYYKVWGKTWADEAKDFQRVSDLHDGMEL